MNNDRLFSQIGRVGSEASAKKRSLALGNPTPGLIKPVDRNARRSGGFIVPIARLAITQQLAQTPAWEESNKALLIDVLKLMSGEVSIPGLAAAQSNAGSNNVYTDGGAGSAEAVTSGIDRLLSSSNFTASERVYGELAYAATYNPDILHPNLINFLVSLIDAGHTIHVIGLIRGELGECPEMAYGCGALFSGVGGISIANQKQNDRESPLWKIIEWILTSCPEENAPAGIKSANFWGGYGPTSILFPQDVQAGPAEQDEVSPTMPRDEAVPGQYPDWGRTIS